jgi:predicted RNA binding protein YcfA (HicA-like mRNA interferase family)
MNTRAFLQHLEAHGCLFHRHGGSHDVWRNPANSKQSSVPRHRSIKAGMARGICRQLNIPSPFDK